MVPGGDRWAPIGLPGLLIVIARWYLVLLSLGFLVSYFDMVDFGYLG